MSIAMLERMPTDTRQSDTDAQEEDWERPAGPLEPGLQPRVDPPTFVYRGSGDEHLRGQSCRPAAAIAQSSSECAVIMACGCQASVPWWTLEPLR